MNAPSPDPTVGYLDGYETRVASRRRYGSTTFTWMEARKDDGGDWVSLGDPWPCSMPRRAEVHAAAVGALWPSS